MLVAPETTKFQYTDGVKDLTRISPDNWVHDQALLDRPGNKDIQLDLFYDYRTNLPLYPQFQAFFRDRKPPTLIIWGKNDKIFPEEGAHPYLRDLPEAEFHLLDTGHFALEDKLDEMAPLIRSFRIARLQSENGVRLPHRLRTVREASSTSLSSWAAICSIRLPHLSSRGRRFGLP